MFSFGTRRKEGEVRRLLRQLVDLTSPNMPPLEGEFRSEGRSNRALPVLLAPWEQDKPVVEESTYAITKDFSERGLSLILPQPFRADEFVVGVWLESPRFVLGKIRQNTPLGGGFWQLGVELTDLLDSAEAPQIASLVPLASYLVPRDNAAATSKLPAACTLG
jgi:hypothetical protein